MHQPNNTDLNDFINQCKIRLKEILDRLEWSEEVTLKDFNTNSVATSRKKVFKYPNTPNILTFPDSCISQNSLALGTSQLQKLLNNTEVDAPRNFGELQGNFSREQKLKIYEHVIENTKKLENSSVDQEAEGEISLADILAQKKREEKHKKRRFRKSKPTHIEEVRCLVDLQMQALQQFMDNKYKKEQPITWQNEIANKDEQSIEDKSREKRSHYGDYYRRGRKRENFTEQHEKPEVLRRYHRSRSKEYVRHKHERYKRSSSKNLSYARTRYSRSRSKERTRRSRSCIRHRSKERNSKSMAKKRHRSRSSERSSRSCSKEISKDIKKYRNPTYERYTRREENDNYGKHFSRKVNGAYYDHDKQKSNEKYYKKEISSFEQRSIKYTTKIEYKSSRQSQSKKRDKS